MSPPTVSVDTHPNRLASGRAALFLLVLLGVSLGVFYLVQQKQFNLVFAILYLLVIGIALLLSSRLGILTFLALASTTGIWTRLALYLSGDFPRFDYIRFANEIIVVVLFLLVINYKSNLRIFASRGMDQFVLLYFLLSTLYVFNVIFAGPAVTVWGWRWVCLPLLMYFVGRRLGYFPKIFCDLSVMMTTVLLMLSSYGAYQAIVGLPAFEQPWFDSILASRGLDLSKAIDTSMFTGGKPRFPSMTEGHAYFNFLLAYLVLWVIFLPSSFWKGSASRISRRLAILMTAICLYFTLERSAIGMIAVGIMTSVFYHLWRRLGWRGLVLIVFLVVVGMLLVSQVDVNAIPYARDTIALRRLAELSTPFRASSVRGRMRGVWIPAIAMLTANPLGYGLGTFHMTSQAMKLSFFLSPHNMYMQAALEIGILGGLAFLLLLWRYLRLLLACFTQPSFAISMASLSSFAAILAIGFLNHPIEGPLALFFWFNVGATVSYIHNLKTAT